MSTYVVHGSGIYVEDSYRRLFQCWRRFEVLYFMLW